MPVNTAGGGTAGTTITTSIAAGDAGDAGGLLDGDPLTNTDVDVDATGIITAGPDGVGLTLDLAETVTVGNTGGGSTPDTVLELPVSRDADRPTTVALPLPLREADGGAASGNDVDVRVGDLLGTAGSDQDPTTDAQPALSLPVDTVDLFGDFPGGDSLADNTIDLHLGDLFLADALGSDGTGSGSVPARSATTCWSGTGPPRSGSFSSNSTRIRARRTCWAGCDPVRISMVNSVPSARLSTTDRVFVLDTPSALNRPRRRRTRTGQGSPFDPHGARDRRPVTCARAPAHAGTTPSGRHRPWPAGDQAPGRRGPAPTAMRPARLRGPDKSGGLHRMLLADVAVQALAERGQWICSVERVADVEALRAEIRRAARRRGIRVRTVVNAFGALVVLTPDGLPGEEPWRGAEIHLHESGAWMDTVRMAWRDMGPE